MTKVVVGSIPTAPTIIMKLKMIDVNGTKSWLLTYYKGAEYHREDGPAIERKDGTKEWCLHGIYFSEQKWLNKVLFNEVKISSL